MIEIPTLYHTTERQLGVGGLIPPGRWGTIITNVGPQHPLYEREMRLEAGRPLHAVSRLRAVYAFEDLERGRWHMEPNHTLYRVVPADPTAMRSRLDMMWVSWVGEKTNYESKAWQVQKYWEGDVAANHKPSAETIWEWLWECPLQVVEVLPDVAPPRTPGS